MVKKGEHAALFQFTPLREGRLSHVLSEWRPRGYFNSRPSARGDQMEVIRLSVMLFQFTPLREGRHQQLVLDCCQAPFQFTPLREGRPSSRHERRPRPTRFQFTPLREGRRNFLPRRMAIPISIHAPPRGATTPAPAWSGRTCWISIHAPPRGATAKDMQFLQIFCSTLTNQHGLTIVPRNLSRLFW